MSEQGLPSAAGRCGDETSRRGASGSGSGAMPPASPTLGRAFLSLSAAGTRALAASLAPALPHGCLLRLEGPLGAGKTTFVQGLALGLGLQGAAKSPTFGLLHAYGPAEAPRLIHLDLYRLGAAPELRELGLDAYLDGSAPIAVEWPQRADTALPAEGLRVSLAEVTVGEEQVSEVGAAPAVDPPTEETPSEAASDAADPAAGSVAFDRPSARRIVLTASDAAASAALAAWRPPLGPELREVALRAGDRAPAAGGLVTVGRESASASEASEPTRPPAAAAAPLRDRRPRAAEERWRRGPLLALDTAGEQAGVAVVDADGRVLARHGWLSRRRHTVELAPTVAEYLAQAGVAAAELGAVAVTLGPGSYTGLRIALALAKGIALAVGCPVVGIPTLDLVAADPRLLRMRPAVGRAPASATVAASGVASISQNGGGMTAPGGLWACMAAGRGRMLAAPYPWPPEPEAYPAGRRPAAWPEPTALRPQAPEALLGSLAAGDLAAGELDEGLATAMADRGISAVPIERDPVVLARLALARLEAAPADPLAALPAEAPLTPLYAG